MTSTPQPYITTLPEQAIAVLRLNHHLRTGHLNLRKLAEGQDYWLHNGVALARAQGVALRRDVIPDPVQALPEVQYITDQWTQCPTAPYIHPATHDLIAAIMGITPLEVKDWICGQARDTPREPGEFRVPYESSDDPTAGLLQALQQHAAHPLLAPHAIQPEDFACHAILIPPADLHAFPTGPDSDRRGALYYRLLHQVLLHRPIHGQAHHEKATFSFYQALEEWLHFQQDKAVRSTWDLKAALGNPYTRLRYPDTDRRLRLVLPESLPGILDPENSEAPAHEGDDWSPATEDMAQSFAAYCISPTQWLLVDGRTLHWLPGESDSLPHFLELPQHVSQPFCQRGQWLYFSTASAQSIVALDLLQRQWALPDTYPSLRYTTEEDYNGAAIPVQEPTGLRIRLSELGGPGVIDPSMTWLWAGDTSSDAIVDLEAGVALQTYFSSHTFQEGAFFLLSDGHLTQMDATHQDLQPWEEMRYEMEEDEEGLVAHERAWADMGRTVHRDIRAVGILGNQWLYLWNNRLYLGRELVLSILFGISHASYDTPHQLLFLANDKLQMVIDLSDPRHPAIRSIWPAQP